MRPEDAPAWLVMAAVPAMATSRQQMTRPIMLPPGPYPPATVVALGCPGNVSEGARSIQRIHQCSFARRAAVQPACCVGLLGAVALGGLGDLASLGHRGQSGRDA